MDLVIIDIIDFHKLDLATIDFVDFDIFLTYFDNVYQDSLSQMSMPAIASVVCPPRRDSSHDFV